MRFTTRPQVLVVDDDPGVRELLIAALADIYIVHAAASGDEACALLRTRPIVAVILDAVLGHEHGLDLVERFRNLSAAPILLLTGYGSEDLAVRALRARVDEYLKKPVSVVGLLAVLRRIIPSDESTIDLATRAGRYLTAHAGKPIRMVELATRLGVGEAHLRRRFRDAHGMTPRHYLAEMRVRRAADLLRTTQREVKQIAQEVGYTDLQLFRRTFTRVLGMTPLRWRLQGKEGKPDRRGR
jgi:YesN/AraC family two-component response regulator